MSSAVGQGETKASDVNMLVNTGPSSNTQTRTNLEFSRKNQKMTDIACCVIFLLYIVLMLAIMAIAMASGNPMRLIYGTDYLGATCNNGPNEPSVAAHLEKKVAKSPAEAGGYWMESSWVNYYKNRKDITYPRTNIDQLVSKLSGADLTKAYPKTFGLPNFYGLCVSACPVSRPDTSAPTVAATLVTKKEFLNTLPTDVVCGIEASMKIQKVCKDPVFQKNMGDGFKVSADSIKTVSDADATTDFVTLTFSAAPGFAAMAGAEVKQPNFGAGYLTTAMTATSTSIVVKVTNSKKFRLGVALTISADAMEVAASTVTAVDATVAGVVTLTVTEQSIHAVVGSLIMQEGKPAPAYGFLKTLTKTLTGATTSIVVENFQGTFVKSVALTIQLKSAGKFPSTFSASETANVLGSKVTKVDTAVATATVLNKVATLTITSQSITGLVGAKVLQETGGAAGTLRTALTGAGTSIVVDVTQGTFVKGAAVTIEQENKLYKANQADEQAQNNWVWKSIAESKKEDCKDSGTGCGVYEELQCVTQFVDRCTGTSEDAQKRCRRAGATDEALKAAKSDCWKQKINSISVVNRCVASRNVQMDVICRAPKQTFAKLCYKSAEKQEIILADATANTYFTTKDACTKMANPSTDAAVVKATPLVPKTSDGKAFPGTCDRVPVDNKCNKLLNYVWDCPENPDTNYPFRSSDENTCMKAGPGTGVGQWLITHYNNTGSKEQTPEEVSASIHSGTGGPSNPGYCSDSVTVTKSVYGVKTNDLYAWLNGAGKTAAGWFADFEKTKTVILVSGIVLSMIMAFSWIMLMKNFAKCICWLTLIFSMLTLIALNLCLYVKAGIIGPNILGGMQALVAKQNPELADQIPNSFPDYLAPSETRKNLYKWTAMFMTAFILIVLVAMFKFRQKINVAIQMCKEAAKAIVSMPLIVFWPFLNVILLVCMMCYFIFIAMYIASAANLQTLNQKVNDKYQASMEKMKDASNYAIDKGNAAATSATSTYNKKVNEWDKEGFSKDDWNAVQHMQWETETVQPLNFEANTMIRYGLIVHTAGMWWISLVIVIVGHYTISSAVAQWYFNAGKYLEQSRAKAKGDYKEQCKCGPCACSFKEQLNTPVVDACKKGCRFHVGSFALSAFLSILVVLLKFCFLWINKIVSFIPGNNACSRKLKACMFFAMGMFDKFVRIISRNGIIMMAIRGENYCTSAGWASWLIFAAQDNPKNLEEGAKSMEKTDKARKAYNKKQAGLIAKLEELTPGPGKMYTSFSFVSGGEVSKDVQIETEKSKTRQLDQERGKLTSYEGPYKTQSYNAAQYAVLSLITDILLFLGKLVVVVSCGIMAYAWVTSNYKDGELTSSAAPIAVAMLFSYFIVSAFMSVYDLSIDTILLCFFYDKLQNKGGPYAMSPQLKKLVLNNLPPGTDKTNMKKGDSFFFSNAVTRRGTISIGAGWDQEQSQPTGAAGQKSAAQMGTAQTSTFVTNPDLDIDLAMAIYDRDAKLLDYIGYMEAVKPNGQLGMALKKTAGGDLFVDSPGKTKSNINPEAVAWSGDDKSGNTSKLNVAGLNEDITVRLHEMPINVDTLAFVLFSFKGPCFNQISDLRLYATECTTSDNRRPEVVAKFNCDFSLDTLEGAQQALLCVTLRRNPGPTFPKGDCMWDADQIKFAREFCSKPIVGDKYVDYLEKEITSKKLIPEILYLEILNLVNAAHENEYDQILNDQKKSHKSGGVANRSLQQRLGVHAEICASDTIFNVLSAASESKCAKKLSAEQLMIWNRTYSKFNTQGGSESHGDMMREDEDYFDCAWEIQAQRELMGNKKFTASVINSVARKCFFFRTPGDKFGAANGSYCGKAVAAAGAFMATA